MGYTEDMLKITSTFLAALILAASAHADGMPDPHPGVASVSAGVGHSVAPIPMTMLTAVGALSNIHLTMPELSASADNLRAVATPLLASGPVMVLRAPDAAALVSVKNPTMVGWVSTDPAKVYATASLPLVRSHVVAWTNALLSGAETGDYQQAHAFLRRMFELADNSKP